MVLLSFSVIVVKDCQPSLCRICVLNLSVSLLLPCPSGQQRFVGVAKAILPFCRCAVTLFTGGAINARVVVVVVVVVVVRESGSQAASCADNVVVARVRVYQTVTCLSVWHACIPIFRHSTRITALHLSRRIHAAYTFSPCTAANASNSAAEPPSPVIVVEGRAGPHSGPSSSLLSLSPLSCAIPESFDCEGAAFGADAADADADSAVSLLWTTTTAATPYFDLTRASSSSCWCEGSGANRATNCGILPSLSGAHC